MAAIKLSREYLYSLVGLREVLWKPDRKGYLHSCIKLGGKTFTAYLHILNFYLKEGYVPERVDHEDGNILNNEPDNLRAATASQNACNRVINSNNMIGVKGVHRNKSGKFLAQIQHNNHKYHVGTFDSVEEAAAAIKVRRTELHGVFARD